MDELTPQVDVNDLLNGTKCNADEVTRNLFKDHKPSIVFSEDQQPMSMTKNETLKTYLRIRSVSEFGVHKRNEYYKVVDNCKLEVCPPAGSNASKFGVETERKRFTFSHVFDESDNQMIVYEAFALPIVQRFLGGQNSLLFAYGITSSGKSYTMRGSTTNPGVIPRALNSIFEVIGNKIDRQVPSLKPQTFGECQCLTETDRQMEERIRQFVFENSDKSFEGYMNSFRSQISVINSTSATNGSSHSQSSSMVWNDVLHSTFRNNSSTGIRCSVWITFYEIYNENIKDLLAIDVEDERKPKIMLIRDRNENYYISGLRQICVGSAEEAYKVLLFGQNNLHISSTNLNKTSSRSHCAFSISLITNYRNPIDQKIAFNLNHLSICDLAGAERSKKANNAGDRIREAGNINGSLLSLSRVISGIRHNQKYENDPSMKKRFVNFRDSKLTKVFQPYLSGSGTAAMIANLNPSPDLFDETLFALKFTGVASQLVVTREDEQNKLQDSLKRLTQIWMQSSEQWSKFAHLRPTKPSISMIQSIKEEDEDDEDSDDDLNTTIQELTQRAQDISQLNLNAEEIETLRLKVEELTDKLRTAEINNMDFEIEVRRQVVNDYNDLITEMEEIADEKDKSKKRLEQMMTQRLLSAEELHKKERLELQSRLTGMETKLFELNEEICRQKEEKDKALTEVELINRVLAEKETIIKNLESLRSQQQLESIITTDDNINNNNNNNEKHFKDMNTSTMDVVVVETTDSSTAALNISMIDKAVETSIIKSNDCETSVTDMEVESTTTGVVEMSDKSTSFSQINFSCDKSVSCDTQCPGCEVINNNNTDIIEKLDKCVSTSPSTTTTDVCTSPKQLMTTTTTSTSPKVLTPMITTSTSPNKNFADNYVNRLEYQQLIDKLSSNDNEIVRFRQLLTEKEIIIDMNRKITCERDQTISQLKEEMSRLQDKLRTAGDYNFEALFKNNVKPTSKSLSSNNSSSVASSTTTMSTKLEDTMSSVVDTNGDITTTTSTTTGKSKKSAKYSSRKPKPNLNTSIEKRYLSAMDTSMDKTIEAVQSSQSSQRSDTAHDEVGDAIFSTKKVAKKTTKRKQHQTNSSSTENNRTSQECLIRDTIEGSRRKRPALKSLYSSPISPIPTAERVTRSRAKKSIKF
ncbi:kinesin-like protein KIF20A [Oppia nitens]|uniref:kinesin-like protein KIF20A n=1 Tax=Oppia nitens TaxID=1686743 RepID=UPI0023DADE2B|nr:kinesin-like protein KIF20A [Oppia nitens]